MNVALHHPSECALCAQHTQGYVFPVASTTVTAIVVLLRVALVCGTVCHDSFENRLFHFFVLILRLLWYNSQKARLQYN